jgi:hypothetical protein
VSGCVIIGSLVVRMFLNDAAPKPDVERRVKMR